MITTRAWIILSLVMACLGIFFTLNSLFTKEQSNNQKAYYLSVNQAVVSGQIIQSSMLMWQPKPNNQPLSGNEIEAENQKQRISIENEVLGALLAKDAKKGDYILKNQLIKSDEDGFLARVVRSGHRAVSLKIQQPAVTDGLISPGDYVDIIATIKATQNRSSNSSTRLSGSDFRTWRSNTVANGVKILALNHHFSGETFINDQKKQKKRSKFVTVTFEVTPEVAVKISLAEQIVSTRGRLTLSLRNPDDERVENIDSLASDLFPGTREEAIKENTLLIRGSKREVSGGL